MDIFDQIKIYEHLWLIYGHLWPKKHQEKFMAHWWTFMTKKNQENFMTIIIAYARACDIDIKEPKHKKCV